MLGSFGGFVLSVIEFHYVIQNCFDALGEGGAFVVCHEITLIFSSEKRNVSLGWGAFILKESDLLIGVLVYYICYPCLRSMIATHINPSHL